MADKHEQPLTERLSLSFLRNDELKEQWASEATVQTVPAKTAILEVGSYIRAIPFVISGAVKVIREDEEGNELYLYHILHGESCAVTLATFLSNGKSKVRAETVEETELMTVPSDTFRNWVKRYPELHQFVLQTYHQRFDELITTLDSVAFQNVDQQLARFLKERSKALGTHRLELTHQAIAYELNTSREVISRLLKKLENDGAIRLGRNRVELVQL